MVLDGGDYCVEGLEGEEGEGVVSEQELGEMNKGKGRELVV